jgi:hypothetical protein
MSLLVVMLSAHDDVFVGYADVDADVIEITLMLVMMVGFHCNLAANDVVAKMLQLGSFFPNSGLYSVRMRNAAKGNL